MVNSVATSSHQPQPSLNNSFSKKTDSETENTTYHTKVMGKDIGEILDGLKKADQAKIDQKQAKIDYIDERVQRLANLEEHISNLSKASSSLFGAGVGLQDGGVFSRMLPIQISGPEGVVDVIASKGARLIDIDIEVRQLAQKDSVSATEGVVDKATALGWTGSFDIGEGDTAKTITLTADMSLQNIMHNVNSVSSTTGIQANITTFSDEARLTFKALDYAKPITVDTTNVTGGASVTNKIPATSQQTVADLSAIVRYEGIEKDVLHSSNRVSAGDQYDGISIDLRNASPDNPVKVSIRNDQSTAGDAIIEFVNTFNAFQEFSASDDMYKGGSFSSALGSLGTIITGEASNLDDTKAKTLHKIGIKLSQPKDDSGTPLPGKKPILQVDPEILLKALDENFDQLSQVFGATHTSSNHNFTLIHRPDERSNMGI